jgi:hypothetical protein
MLLGTPVLRLLDASMVAPARLRTLLTELRGEAGLLADAQCRALLSAWARYEDEQPDGAPRSRAQQARSDWGSMARRFLERED